MTKNNMKELVSKWNREQGKKSRDRNDVIFHEMKELANKNGFPMYCSMSELLKVLIGTNDEYKAFRLYAEFNENQGRWESLLDFLKTTNNFDL